MYGKLAGATQKQHFEQESWDGTDETDNVVFRKKFNLVTVAEKN